MALISVIASSISQSFCSGFTALMHIHWWASCRWLDKAAILEKHGIREDDTEHTISDRSVRNGWRLSSVTEVEELKAVLRLVPVWAASIFFNTIYSQAGTLMVEEGEKMDTSFWGFTMEPATMNMFNILVVVFLPPLYDAVIVPLARRFTGTPRGITPLYRTAVGYVLCICSLSLAAILEAVRLQHVNGGLSPPSIFWQVPQFMLLGSAQFLAGIGQLEFFYTYAPRSLRSLGSAFCLTCIALGDYVSSILVTIVTFATARGGVAGWIASADLDDGHLDYFFWLMAALAFLNFLLYLACARSFTKQRFQVDGRAP
jgi:peptide/histidine transporter 3/4